MENNIKKAYVAPEIYLQQCRVEKGFAGSCLSNNTPDHCQIEGWRNEDAIFFFARVINLFKKLFSRQSPAIA